MSKNEKLTIGKPYSIILREGNRIMKISGDFLSKEDVEEFINNGILKPEDVLTPDNKEFKCPKFEDVILEIDEKFFPWRYFTYNLYNKYPSVAKSLILKEYSNIICKKVNPKDKVYLISMSDGSVFAAPATKDILSNHAFFPDENIAKQAYESMINGVVCFTKS